MYQLPFLVDLASILAVALIAGLIARRLRQSTLLAYLLAGVIIGPNALGLVSNTAGIQALAELGVALLMFTLGVEFSFREIYVVQRFAVFGGILQIILTTAAGFALGLLLDFGLIQSAYLGCVVAISSTVIVLRSLQERGEAETAHGRALLGMLIIQDLAVVAMLGILPILPDLTVERLPELGATVLKAAAYLVLVFILARRWIPAVLRMVAATGVKELFALTILSIVFATALGTQAIGFSLAVGAFIAGLVVSESEFSHEVLAQVAPLRDIFAIVFFISLGMLVDLSLFLRYPGAVTTVLLVILLGKALIGSGVALGFGYQLRSALMIGLGLTQIGELSFVIARDGLAREIVSPTLYGIILISALISIILTPPLLAAGPVLAARLLTTGNISQYLGRRTEPRLSVDRVTMHDHVIIIGYGRVGRSIGAAMERFNFMYVVIDFDLRVIEELRQVGVPVIYGDAAHEEVLRNTSAEAARMAVLTLPDMLTTSIAARILLRINPDLKIVARVHSPEAVGPLLQEGVDEVVEPEFEAGIEIMRHTLLLLGIPLNEVQTHADRIRQFRYPILAEPSPRIPTEEITDHYILCGYGRLGRQISEELLRADIPQVVVEIDSNQVVPLPSKWIPVIIGNAHDESVLIRAGIKRARGLVAATSSDAENLYITTSARHLNPGIYIIARTNRAEDEEKFLMAGANRVVYPYGMGAKSMAVEILRPHVAAFLESLIKEEAVNWDIAEAVVSAESSYVGKTLSELDITERIGATVIGVQTVNGNLIHNPGLDYVVQAGDILIVLADKDQLTRLRIESSPSEDKETS